MGNGELFIKIRNGNIEYSLNGDSEVAPAICQLVEEDELLAGVIAFGAAVAVESHDSAASLFFQGEKAKARLQDAADNHLGKFIGGWMVSSYENGFRHNFDGDAFEIIKALMNAARENSQALSAMLTATANILLSSDKLMDVFVRGLEEGAMRMEKGEPITSLNFPDGNMATIH